MNSQNYQVYKNEHLTNNSKMNRNNQSRFRSGKGNRKHNSRNESDSNQSSLQIMGNGDIVYTKRNNFSNKGVKQGGNYRERKNQPKRNEKKNYQAPPLGVSHFPPLGKKANNDSRINNHKQRNNFIDEKQLKNSLPNSIHETQSNNDSKRDVSESELLNNKKKSDETEQCAQELVNGIKESSQEIVNETNKLMEGLLNGSESKVEDYISKDGIMRPNWAEIAKARNNQS